MDDNDNNPNREVGEDPKRVFRLFLRLGVKPERNSEDPKAFLRRMGQRVQRQNPNPGEAARA